MAIELVLALYLCTTVSALLQLWLNTHNDLLLFSLPLLLLHACCSQHLTAATLCDQVPTCNWQ
jgi:hypothetical protein